MAIRVSYYINDSDSDKPIGGFSSEAEAKEWWAGNRLGNFDPSLLIIVQTDVEALHKSIEENRKDHKSDDGRCSNGA